jgi:hypothetical protein
VEIAAAELGFPLTRSLAWWLQAVALTSLSKVGSR